MTDPVGGSAPSQGWKPTEAQVVMPRGDSRRPLLGAIVVAALLVLAVLKPWGGPSDASRAVASDTPTATLAGEAATSPGPATTRPATPPAFGAPGGQCYPGADWRVFAIEMRTGRFVQHWLSIEPGAAQSPRDSAVPLVSIVTDSVLALGFCVGSGPDDRRPLVGARAWALAPEGPAVPVALAPLIAFMPRQGNLGAVYRPPAGSSTEAGAGWSPGHYVFAVRQGPGQGDEQWFGVEVLATPQVSAAP